MKNCKGPCVANGRVGLEHLVGEGAVDACDLEAISRVFSGDTRDVLLTGKGKDTELLNGAVFEGQGDDRGDCSLER